MARLLIRRIVFLLISPVLAAALGLAYAVIARDAFIAQNPFMGAPDDAPLIGRLLDAARGLAQPGLGLLPTAGQTVAGAVVEATLASGALLICAFALAILVAGTTLWITSAVNRTWLHNVITGLSSTAVALPSFYIGLVATLVIVQLALGESAPPVSGYGLDAHLLLPALSLALRPAGQLIYGLSALIGGERDQIYITVARAYGRTEHGALISHALPNIGSRAVLILASALRGLIAELVIVEWLFDWPGLGRLLTKSLLTPGGNESLASSLFLFPNLLAGLLAVFVFALVASDAASAAAARLLDQRLRDPGAETGEAAR